MTSTSLGAESLEETNRLFDETRRGLEALAELQDRYDTDMWDISDPQFANLRHIHLHLSITVGKIAKLIEPEDHRHYHGDTPDVASFGPELEPILADLVMHATQIANLTGGSLGDMLRARYKQNAGRFAPDSTFSAL